MLVLIIIAMYFQNQWLACKHHHNVGSSTQNDLLWPRNGAQFCQEVFLFGTIKQWVVGRVLNSLINDQQPLYEKWLRVGGVDASPWASCCQSLSKTITDLQVIMRLPPPLVSSSLLMKSFLHPLLMITSMSYLIVQLIIDESQMASHPPTPYQQPTEYTLSNIIGRFRSTGTVVKSLKPKL